MALENFGNSFLLLCGHPDWVAGGCESRNCHCNVDRFQNSFTLTILDKSVTKSLQKNSQHLIRVSTVHSVLPGAVLMHSGQWLGFSVAPCRMFVRQCESFEQWSHRSEIALPSDLWLPALILRIHFWRLGPTWTTLLWPPCVADADIIFSSCGFFFFLLLLLLLFFLA